MIDLRWTKGATDLVHFEYDYDRVSNRLFERNLITGSGGSNPAVDSLLGYDELNRLTSFKQGELNTAGDAIASPGLTQDWTLDETGNFKGFTQGVVDAVTQTRTHNKVNEITNITETAGAAWATPSHDDAGNMTAIPKPSDLTSNYDASWDAWNRLVELSESSSTVAQYEYDGIGRRIVKKVYASGLLDQTRHIFYSAQSQAIEARIDSSTDAETQFVWNLGYVDHLLLRDRDTTSNSTLDERIYALSDLRYSVVALADTSGAVLERIVYDAHGVSESFASDYSSSGSSSYDWEFRYTGRRHNLDSGLLFFRSRYYHPQLGRFASRDPLGFVDGMSLYRAYFVPNQTDASGLSGVCCKCFSDPTIFARVTERYIDCRTSARRCCRDVCRQNGEAFFGVADQYSGKSWRWCNSLTDGTTTDAGPTSGSTVVLGCIGADICTPEPSDVLPQKWVCWGLALGGALAIDCLRCIDISTPVDSEPPEIDPDPCWFEYERCLKTKMSSWKGKRRNRCHWCLLACRAAGGIWSQRMNRLNCAYWKTDNLPGK